MQTVAESKTEEIKKDAKVSAISLSSVKKSETLPSARQTPQKLTKASSTTTKAVASIDLST